MNIVLMTVIGIHPQHLIIAPRRFSLRVNVTPMYAEPISLKAAAPTLCINETVLFTLSQSHTVLSMVFQLTKSVIL